MAAKSAWCLATMVSCIVGGCGADVRAQVSPTMPNDPNSYVMQWGRFAYDTRSREGRIRKAVCGWNSTGYLRTDGRLFVQGSGGSGTGAPGWRWVHEVPSLPPGLFYKDVSINSWGAMAIRSDGSAIGWGELGLTSLPPAAPLLPAGLAYTRVALSTTHGILLRSDGAVVTFGSNSFGQCSVPPLPPGMAVLDIQAGYGRSALLMADGTAILFGNNQSGQGTVPTLPPGVVYIAMAAKRNDFTLLLRSDGLIEAFGVNTSGECNVPPLPPGLRYVFVGAGDLWSAAVRSDNTFVVWGAGTTSYGIGSPPGIPTGPRCVGFDVGQAHAVALLSDGSVLSWGHNNFFDHYIPYRARPGGLPSKRHVDVASGPEHSLLTYSDGTMDAFGKEGAQLNVPPLPLGVRYVRGGAGQYHSLALRSDGTVVAFGYGSSLLNVPPLPAGMTYTDLAVEYVHSVLLRSDGNAFAFGNNSFGQCNIPPLPPGVTYTKAAVNQNRTLLLRSDGTLAYSGWLYQGSLPTPPPGTRFVDIAASAWFAVAIASDNTVVSWGSVGGSYWWVAPQPLPSGVYYVQVHGGYDQVVFRRSDGAIDVMGVNVTHGADVPLLDPGTSCVQVSGVGESLAARMSSTCTYVGFAPGCAGSMPAAKLIPRDTPRIGRNFEVRVRNLPANLAALSMGLQRAIVPIPLAAIGMPGCNLAIQVDDVVFLTGQGNEATHQMPIPDLVSFVGLRFYQQAFVFDAGAGNPLGAVVSEASEGVIGYP